MILCCAADILDESTQCHYNSTIRCTTGGPMPVREHFVTSEWWSNYRSENECFQIFIIIWHWYKRLVTEKINIYKKNTTWSFIPYKVLRWAPWGKEEVLLSDKNEGTDRKCSQYSLATKQKCSDLLSDSKRKYHFNGIKDANKLCSVCQSQIKALIPAFLQHPWLE